jgi:GNAT superfamily N-acetyltransferase
MSAPNFVIASLQDHRDDLLALNVAYVSWVFDEIEKAFGVRSVDTIGMTAAEYVESVLDKVCNQSPPEGTFYLLQHQGQFVGMGGLRGLAGGAAEVKRVYVRPEFRGARLGESMVARLVEDAARFGYRRVCLDTALFMASAHRIYEAAGFVDCAPYPEAEVPPAFHSRWRFMERPVTPAATPTPPSG